MSSSTADLRSHALAVARSVVPEAMTPVRAAEAVADLAVAEKAIATARMFLALHVAHSEAWQGRGHASAADWLAAQTGTSVSEAARQLGTARKASQLPKTKKAMREGKLSPNQADAVTDAATADPDAEDDLLGSAANDTNKTLRDKAAKAKAAKVKAAKVKAAKVKAAATDDDQRERRIRADRSLRRGTDADGAFWLRLYGPATTGAALEAMLRPFEESVFRHHRAAGIASTHDHRSHDASFALLAHLHRAESAGAPAAAPAPGPGAMAGADPTTPDEPGHPVEPPSTSPSGNTAKVIVLVDHTALLRGHTIAGETCEIAGLGPISVRTARAILHDDPFLAVAIRKGRDVVNVAHHGRGLNAHQRTAIEATGLHCTNIACNRTIAIEIDHRVPYATDPVTQMDNQDPLCPECHRRKTHHGWTLEPGTGRRPLLPPIDATNRRARAPARARSQDGLDEDQIQQVAWC